MKSRLQRGLAASRGSEPGVALVITLIFLAVITFMAVTFLVVTRAERARAITESSQSDAKFANDTALEYAKAQIVATMLARNNSHDFSLFVSTNYINTNGFNAANYPGYITNVSYTYAGGGQVLGKDIPKLVSNLRFLPRVPVYVSTNRNPAFPPDFRFYLDLNRNGVYDPNGLGTNYLDLATGTYLKNADGSMQLNSFVGDPEWIGILNHPELSHSASNLFVARYAFIAIPIGNTLDINYIHNMAKQPGRLHDGFLRNEGFGSWELNLAAYLHYFNTNVWSYNYLNANPLNINSLQPSSGTAFEDAAEFVSYRYNTLPANGNWPNLTHFFNLYGNNAARAFGRDGIDGYSHGPLWVTTQPPINPATGDGDANLTASAWPGADNPQHFFTTQDLFNFTNQLSRNLLAAQSNPASNFVDRLTALSSNTNNSDQRYSFYKFLSQAGFESAPEAPGKINLNYASVPGTNSSSYIAWTPLQFFTNAADKLLKDLVLNAPGILPTNLGVLNIQVYPTNYYTPSVHRMLQLAANIYDATTNRTFPGTTNVYPSVFRPTFGYVKNGVTTNVFINGYEEVGNIQGNLAGGNFSDPVLATPLSLPESLNLLVTLPATNRVNIYGVPWVVGARKGLPNFNQFGYQTVSQITRRLNVNKPSGTAPRSAWRTNQLYVIGVSNIVGLDGWNSYSTPYPRNLYLYANDDLKMSLSVSNNGAFAYTTNLPLPTAGNSYFSPQSNLLVTALVNGSWPAYPINSPYPAQNALSFQSYKSNVVFVPGMAYHVNPGVTGNHLDTNTTFEPLSWPPPDFVLTVTNRLRFILFDTGTAGQVRVLDYAQFGGVDNGGMDTRRDLTAELQMGDATPGPGLWNTNFNKNGSPVGINNQIQVALGNVANLATLWVNAQLPGTQAKSMNDAIAGFSAFWNNSNSNGLMEVPFTPTAQYNQSYVWQANDPLVHYTIRDLITPLSQNNGVLQGPQGPPGAVPFANILPKIGHVTDRYQPWNYPISQNYGVSATDPTFKDPLISRSDLWDFPTNKFPSIGWLGRVHRGTPWQTIYLKSAPMIKTSWTNWTGDNIIWRNTQGQLVNDSHFQEPTNDWRIFDFFTVAPNDNATRGRLSINQTNAAAWAAVLHGVVVLTNTAAGYNPLVIDPNFNDAAFSNIVAGIYNRRFGTNAQGQLNYPSQVFTNLGDILSVPELTDRSPFLSPNNSLSLNDEIYERLPEQILSLLKVGEPRYVIFCYGQSLKPADHSVYQAPGNLFGMVTNYQVTGEVVTRAVVRITDQTRPLPTLPNVPLGLPQRSPQVVVESFNVLPPE